MGDPTKAASRRCKAIWIAPVWATCRSSPSSSATLTGASSKRSSAIPPVESSTAAATLLPRSGKRRVTTEWAAGERTGWKAARRGMNRDRLSRLFFDTNIGPALVAIGALLLLLVVLRFPFWLAAALAFGVFVAVVLLKPNRPTAKALEQTRREELAQL